MDHSEMSESLISSSRRLPVKWQLNLIFGFFYSISITLLHYQWTIRFRKIIHYQLWNWRKSSRFSSLTALLWRILCGLGHGILSRCFIFLLFKWIFRGFLLFNIWILSLCPLVRSLGLHFFGFLFLILFLLLFLCLSSLAGLFLLYFSDIFRLSFFSQQLGLAFQHWYQTYCFGLFLFQWLIF
jgi:hypothetical protein